MAWYPNISTEIELSRLYKDLKMEPQKEINSMSLSDINESIKKLKGFKALKRKAENAEDSGSQPKDTTPFYLAPAFLSTNFGNRCKESTCPVCGRKKACRQLRGELNTWLHCPNCISNASGVNAPSPKQGRINQSKKRCFGNICITANPKFDEFFTIAFFRNLK